MSSDALKVLVVEDLKAAQLVAYSIFKTLGCYVSVASTAMRGFETLMSQHFDIIFLDIQLPDINGFNFAERLRSLERKSHTPLIAVTANSSEGFAEETKRYGFNDYLLKPLTLESVRHILFKNLPPDKQNFKTS